MVKEAYKFVENLYSKLEVLNSLLAQLLREEKILEESILVKSGFILRHYSLRWDKINPVFLKKLRDELVQVEAIESDIQHEYEQTLIYIKELERAYEAYNGKKLRLEDIFTKYMYNAFHLSKWARDRIDYIINLLESGLKLHPVGMAQNAKRAINSLQRSTNQIMKFVDVVRQLTGLVAKFSKKQYYPSPRTYGRAMSPREAKNTLKFEELIGSPKRKVGDLLGVFDCPLAVRESISKMNPDQRKNYFAQIGVTGAVSVVFFQTALKPKSEEGIRQTNNLIEFKFPKGTPIEILAAA